MAHDMAQARVTLETARYRRVRSSRDLMNAEIERLQREARANMGYVTMRPHEVMREALKGLMLSMATLLFFAMLFMLAMITDGPFV